MITIDDIKKAKNTQELNEKVETAAYARNCELDNSLSYAENADWYAEESENPLNHDSADSLSAMADILRAADTRWFELEELSVGSMITIEGVIK